MKYLLGEKLNLDWKIAVITITSTTLLIVDHYRTLTGNKYYDRVIWYLLIPLLVTILIFRESPKEYGFSLGDWKLGIIFTMVGILLMTPVIYFLARGDAQTQKYYGGSVIGLPWTTFMNLVGWEFFFRGWILFGYARKFRHEALWLQAVPFALAHIGKPEIETLSTIFGGFAFGWVAWRTKSFLYPFLIHWYISTLIILVAAGVI
jgi:membrane protease YdiL (CAAX protease family)